MHSVGQHSNTLDIGCTLFSASLPLILLRRYHPITSFYLINSHASLINPMLNIEAPQGLFSRYISWAINEYMPPCMRCTLWSGQAVSNAEGQLRRHHLASHSVLSILWPGPFLRSRQGRAWFPPPLVASLSARSCE